MTRKPYGLLCPISRACELLEPRWTIQILTEMWSGSTRFNEIRRGVGHISPGLLSKRLKELEEKGLIERVEDRGAGTVDYFRTEMGQALEPALDALAHWAQRHIDAEVALCDTDVSNLMWKMRRWIIVDELPPRRIVMRIRFTDEGLDYDTYWILTQPGAVPEICTSDPGFDVDLWLEVNAVSFGGILLRRTTLAREIDAGEIFVSGDQRLARTIPRWLPGSDYGGDGIAELRPEKPERAQVHVE